MRAWDVRPLKGKGLETAGRMHAILIEHLRIRESEVFRFLAILGPVFGGYAWLMADVYCRQRYDFGIQLGGIVVTQMLLFLGTAYATALGYHCRTMTVQIAKLEAVLGIEGAILNRWPKTPQEFSKRLDHSCSSSWIMPELIKVFWITFLCGIVLVTITGVLALCRTGACCGWISLAGVIGTVLLGAGGCCLPRHYSAKLRKILDEQ